MELPAPRGALSSDLIRAPRDEDAVLIPCGLTQRPPWCDATHKVATV